jgi:hypothetical protein
MLYLYSKEKLDTDYFEIEHVLHISPEVVKPRRTS